MAKAKPVPILDIHAPTGDNARIVARTRLEEMYEWEKYVDDPHRVHELHDLRIAAKRLRYTLETFEDVLPESCASIVKDVEQIQEKLGVLHDSDVMIALLQRCLEGQHSKDGTSGVDRENALSRRKSRQAEQPVALNSDLVMYLTDSATAPSGEERYGLEQLLLRVQRRREEQYTAFRQYWHQLQERNFRHEVLSMLGA